MLYPLTVGLNGLRLWRNAKLTPFRAPARSPYVLPQAGELLGPPGSGPG
jgi:hypothetical protein